MPASYEVWSGWSTSMSEGKSTPGAPVTAVPWGNRFALFIADPNGGIYTAAAVPYLTTRGNPCGPWASVSEGKSTPGAPVTAVPWGNRIAVFLADPNGGIYTAAGDPQAGFGPWASVSEGRSTPGAPVTAVPWGNRIAVFLADPGGGIYTTGGDPQRGFGLWASVSEGRSTPGAPVTAVPWRNHIILFLADPGGGVYRAMGDPQAGFGPWASVSEGRSAPGGRVTAVPWGNRIALFLADPGGGIYRAVGDPQAGFGPLASVSEGRSTPGAPVTAVPWGSGFALFITDPGGGIYTTGGDPQGGFGPWAFVLDGLSAPGAPVTAVPYGKRLGLFITDPDGGVQGGIILTTQGNPGQPIGAPRAHADQSILETQFQNPAPPLRDSQDSWALSGGKTWPGDEERAWEWSQVLARTEEFDLNLVGAAGWVRSPDNSKADVPFDHPFGGLENFPFGRVDWEFGLELDAQYNFLLSPANLAEPEDRSQASKTLGVEWDQALIPASFRGNVSDGDRVAIFGRWILDQGHEVPEDGDPSKRHYRTEIHPPLLIATGSVQQDPTGGQFTRVLFMSRPFLVGQTYAPNPNDAFGDTAGRFGSLYEVADVEGHEAAMHQSNQFEAYTMIKSYPFRGAHLLHIVVRPPALGRPPVPHFQPSQIVVSFRFTIRSGCAVQVSSIAKDSVDVLIALNSVGFTPFPLPKGTTRRYFPEDLNLLTPGSGNELVDKIAAKSGRAAQVLEQNGIKTNDYPRLAEIDILDRGNAVSGVVSGLGPILAGQGVTVNDSQPYPVFGWLEAKWAASGQIA